jgi:hypothetical protein
MKKTLHFLVITVMAISVTFTSCKKADTSSDNSELATHSDDQSRFSNETDAVANDANTAIESFSAFEGRIENSVGVLCNSTAVLDSTATLRRITITYNGLNCQGNRFRLGVVVLSMPLGQRWRDQNAVLTTTFQNLKITRVSDNKSITINGVHLVKNVTGGRLGNLATLGTIIHEITSPGMSVTFDDGTIRNWQVGKRRTFTYNNGIVITTIGIHTDGTITGISEWGINRFGNAFVTSITQPMVIRQDCDFRLVSGQVTHQRLSANAVVTFGLNAAGNPTTCPGIGTYYLKLVWTGANGVVRTVILPY